MSPWRERWSLPTDVTYLNHGSFGPTPSVVQSVQREWAARLASEPMDFFLRQQEDALIATAERLGRLVGAAGRDLALIDNATVAMNIVAASVALQPDDEVLLNDHEYGAVRRIWQAACQRQGSRLTTVSLPCHDVHPHADEWTEAILNAITPRTKLIVVSHVTSATALRFPVEAICRGAAERGVPVAIDGPHAVGMLPLDLSRLGATFYCASLHKWLSAPLGSGFLWVRRDWQSRIQPPIISWGRSLCGRPVRWQDPLDWMGTRDLSGLLSIPATLDLWDEVGLDNLRTHGAALAQSAAEQLAVHWGTQPLRLQNSGPALPMVTIPLPAGPVQRKKPNDFEPLQQQLWDRFRIEVLMPDWNDRRHLRVSCHLYNDHVDVERLVNAVRELDP